MTLVRCQATETEFPKNLNWRRRHSHAASGISFFGFYVVFLVDFDADFLDFGGFRCRFFVWISVGFDANEKIHKIRRIRVDFLNCHKLRFRLITKYRSIVSNERPLSLTNNCQAYI